MDSVAEHGGGGATADSVALLDAMLKVSQLVRLRLNDWLGQFELTDGRLGVLLALSQAGRRGLSQAELAETLGQSASNVSTLIERMSRDGLVTRLPSTNDRRKRILLISPGGLSQLVAVEKKRPAWSRNLLQMITIEEQSEFLILLREIGAGIGASCQALPSAAEFNDGTNRTPIDPSCDPESPQFALRQMLLALSSSTDHSIHDERAVA